MKRKVTAPPWLPDWRDGTLYPAPAAPAFDWRWQFVRRSPAYREDYASMVVPNLNPDNSYAPWTKHFRERFGMHFAWDPADQAPPFVWADGNVTSNVGPIGRDQQFNTLVKANEVYVKFDLTRPLVEQQRLAEKWLRQQREVARRTGLRVRKPAKPRIAQLPKYLRVLDAEAHGATNAQIASVLARRSDDPEEWVHNGLKAARLLRDRNFASLPTG